MTSIPIRLLLCLSALVGFTLPVQGQPEPPPAEIVLGMSAALEGPAAGLGRGMKEGIEAAIGEVNRAGGVRGRQVRLIALDDGYEPSRAAPNMHALIGRHNALAIIGNVGTPTAVAALPVAIESSTPFVGAFTGAGVLRKNPPDRCVINYRASYAEETGAMVDALIDHAGLKPEEIAFFTQRDAYGDSGFSGGIAALRTRGLADPTRIAHGRYERNTVLVENALADILGASVPCKAVIMVGAYAPCAQFIRLARQHSLNAAFLNVSFVGSDQLARELGPAGEGVVVTQVVPHVDADLPITRAYRAALHANSKDAVPGFVSLEGYAACRMLLAALDKVPGDPDRPSVIAALEDLGRFDLGTGAPLELSKTQHQASHAVWPTVIRGGRVVPASWTSVFSATKAEVE